MGTAYFRVVPRRSRSSDMVIAEPSASRSRTRRRSSLSASASRNRFDVISTTCCSSRSKASNSATIGPRWPADAASSAGVGGAHAPGADRIGELVLEFPFALAQLGLVAGERHRTRAGNDLALRLEPIEQTGHQCVVRQVGESRGELGARDRRQPRTGRVQPAQCAHGLCLPGRRRPPPGRGSFACGPTGKLDQIAGGHQRRHGGFDLGDGQAGERAQAKLSPGRESEKGQAARAGARAGQASANGRGERCA